MPKLSCLVDNQRSIETNLHSQVKIEYSFKEIKNESVMSKTGKTQPMGSIMCILLHLIIEIQQIIEFTTLKRFI